MAVGVSLSLLISSSMVAINSFLQHATGGEPQLRVVAGPLSQKTAPEESGVVIVWKAKKPPAVFYIL